MNKYQFLRPLTIEEYQSLKQSIKENGILVPIVLDEERNILDGHHRVQAWRELIDEGICLPDYPFNIQTTMDEEQKRNVVWALNEARRHLSLEELQHIRSQSGKRVAIAESLKQIPERADNWHAKQLGVSDHTVQSVRETLEATSQIARLDRLTGKDGRERPATRPKQKEVNGEVRPVTKAKLREVVKYVEVVEKYPQLATLPHGKAIKEAQKMESAAPRQLTEADTFIFLLNRITRPIEEAAETIENSLNRRPKFTEAQIDQIRKDADVFLATAQVLTSHIKNNSKEASYDEIAQTRGAY